MTLENAGGMNYTLSLMIVAPPSGMYYQVGMPDNLTIDMNGTHMFFSGQVKLGAGDSIVMHLKALSDPGMMYVVAFNSTMVGALAAVDITPY
ncbi:hypothetical protein [Thermogymnomonas acidicola]|uniref:hypothetical protein n=1 Tax=Thermogymnomonas acidicola TaxID=399579 RepID=UPI0009466E37|nr:hypothetical protein [Thermogymnomonas acidicola]